MVGFGNGGGGSGSDATGRSFLGRWEWFREGAYGEWPGWAMAPPKVRMQRLPDALEDRTRGIEHRSTPQRRGAQTSKGVTTSNLFTFLGGSAISNEPGQEETRAYPKHKLEATSKDAQNERMTLLSIPRRHGKAEKVQSTGISKSPLDWHLHFAAQTPGPGQYDVTNMKRSISGPVLHSGPESRTALDQACKESMTLPGPNEYKPTFLGKRVTHGLMGSRRTDPHAKPNQQPQRESALSGPADPKPRSKVIVHSFGPPVAEAKPRYRKVKDKRPGPGVYNVTQRPKSAGPTFARGPRSYVDDPRYRIQSCKDQPGPGEYDYQLEAPPGGTISKHTPKSVEARLLQQAKKLPGPGYYNIAVESKPPTTRLDTSDTKSGLDWHIYYFEKNAADGNADYDLPRNPLPQGGRWSTSVLPNSSEAAEKRASQLPGPTDYGLPGTHKIPGGRLSTAVVPRSCFGDSEAAIREIARLPGPGAYQGAYPSTLKTSGGKIAWLGRTVCLEQQEKTRAEGPGPGDYQSIPPSAAVKTPKFRPPRPNEQRGMPISDVPGPGDYNLDDSEIRHVTGGRFGKQLVQDLKAYEIRESMGIPGPGAYAVPSTLLLRGGRLYHTHRVKAQVAGASTKPQGPGSTSTAPQQQPRNRKKNAHPAGKTAPSRTKAPSAKRQGAALEQEHPPRSRNPNSTKVYVTAPLGHDKHGKERKQLQKPQRRPQTAH